MVYCAQIDIAVVVYQLQVFLDSSQISFIVYTDIKSTSIGIHK